MHKIIFFALYHLLKTEAIDCHEQMGKKLLEINKNRPLILFLKRKKLHFILFYFFFVLFHAMQNSSRFRALCMIDPLKVHTTYMGNQMLMYMEVMKRLVLLQHNLHIH